MDYCEVRNTSCVHFCCSQRVNSLGDKPTQIMFCRHGSLIYTPYTSLWSNPMCKLYLIIADTWYVNMNFHLYWLVWLCFVFSWLWFRYISFSRIKMWIRHYLLIWWVVFHSNIIMTCVCHSKYKDAIYWSPFIRLGIMQPNQVLFVAVGQRHEYFIILQKQNFKTFFVWCMKII